MVTWLSQQRMFIYFTTVYQIKFPVTYKSLDPYEIFILIIQQMFNEQLSCMREVVEVSSKIPL